MVPKRADLDRRRHLAGFATVLAATGLVLASVAGAADATARRPTSHERVRILVRDVGLSTPESVEYDSTADVYLVSNVAGPPRAADGNGFVSRIAPDGRVLALRWIDGRRSGVRLDAPKGLAIVGDRLYVADIDHVRVFDRATGRPLRDVAVPGAAFLNGIAPAPGAGVYVTDSGFGAPRGSGPADAVYRVTPEGRVTTIARARTLEHPNGVHGAGHGTLLVVTFGANRVLRVDHAGRIVEWSRTPRGSLDGLVRLPDGRWVVSSWDGGALSVTAHAAMRGDARDAPPAAPRWIELAHDLDAPADLGIDPRRRRVLVPLFRRDAVAVVGY